MDDFDDTVFCEDIESDINFADEDDGVELYEVRDTELVLEKPIDKKLSKRIKENITKIFKDPIMLMMFSCPVLADDDNIYEREHITEYFNTIRYGNIKSPVTRQRMTKRIEPVPLIRNLIKEWVRIHPEDKEYVHERDYTYTNNVLGVLSCLQNHDFTELRRYTGFLLYELADNRYPFVFLLFRHCSDLETIKYVFDNSVDVRGKNIATGSNLLHYACIKASPMIINHVLTMGFDINQKNKSGNTPLHLLCNRQNGIDEAIIMDMIEDLHCDPLIINNDNLTAPQLACINPRFNIDMMSYFVDKQLLKEDDVFGSTNATEYTIHIISKRCNNLALYKNLKRAGWDMNKPTSTGSTPLHYVSQHQTNIKIIDFLIAECGARTDVSDSNGWLPFHFACRYNNTEVIHHYLFNGCGAYINHAVRYNNRTCTSIELIKHNVRNDRRISTGDFEAIQMTYFSIMAQQQVQSATLSTMRPPPDLSDNLDSSDSSDDRFFRGETDIEEKVRGHFIDSESDDDFNF